MKPTLLKRTLCALCAGMLLLSATACDSTQNTASDSNPSSETSSSLSEEAKDPNRPLEDEDIFPTRYVQKTVQAMVNTDPRDALPATVELEMSDGGTVTLPVEWQKDSLGTVNMGAYGVYEVLGKVNADLYADPFITERADPFITKAEDGTYYFTASYPATGPDNGYDRIILRTSDTLKGLSTAEEITIWEAHEEGEMAKHVWAPEMHNIGGVWYIYFASGTSSNEWDIKPYVLACTGGDPTNPDHWEEKGVFQATVGDSLSFTGFSLDMTHFETGGKHYVIWAQKIPDSALFIAEIDPATPWKLSSMPTLLTKPEYDWEKVVFNVDEGASVFQTDEKIFVFFSASGTGEEYCMGRMYADVGADMLSADSWTKEDQPVLTSDDVNGVGPGHNSFTEDDYGNPVVVFHARPETHLTEDCGTYNEEPLYDPCRHARLRYVYVGTDGVPRVNVISNAMFPSDDERYLFYTLEIVEE